MNNALHMRAGVPRPVVGGAVRKGHQEHEAMKRVIRWICWVVYGHVTDAIKGIDGGVVSEVAYYDRRGRRIGYWAYGAWDPKMSWLARKACE